VLRYLSDDGTWEEVEAQLGRRPIRVYDLHQGPVRLDSTGVAVYHDGDNYLVPLAQTGKVPELPSR